MKKIISLFKRDYEGTRLVYDEVVEGAEWVLAGEGKATEKIDGTCCLWQDGMLYKRYDAKADRKYRRPENWVAAQEEPDPVTGHWPGWIPIDDGSPEDRWHRDALTCEFCIIELEGKGETTCELIGPRVQGNPYGMMGHHLEIHGRRKLLIPDLSFEGIKRYLENKPQYEGIVWHHPDGRMVKIKRKDFGLPWPTPEAKGSVTL